MRNLSETCTQFYKFFKPELNQRALPKLAQAVIDDDRVTVRNMLNANPELLLIPLPKNFTIESQYTWQRFDLSGETLLSIAAKRHQLEMIKIMLPCFNLLLEQTDLAKREEVIAEKEAALACWHEYQFYTEWNAYDYYNESVSKIVIPKEYADLIDKLIRIFRQETLPNGMDQYSYGQLSKQTEDALAIFFKQLLPENATRLDEYLDPELLLYAAYDAGYVNHFNTFQHWEVRDAFYIRVIGLVQSVLPPETAKIFCEGLSRVVIENKERSDCADALQLPCGEFFYRLSRESFTRLGFEYFIGAHPTTSRLCSRFSRGGNFCIYFSNVCETKASEFSGLMQSQPHVKINPSF
jgi:hypothetical protein